MVFVRLAIGLVMLVIAAAFLGFAGGIDIASIAEWSQAAQKWSLPPASETVRGLALITGGIFVLLASVRFLNHLAIGSAAADGRRRASS